MNKKNELKLTNKMKNRVLVNLKGYAHRILGWARAQGLDNEYHMGEYQRKLTTEFGKLARRIIYKDRPKKVKKSIGDIFITQIILLKTVYPPAFSHLDTQFCDMLDDFAKEFDGLIQYEQQDEQYEGYSKKKDDPLHYILRMADFDYSGLPQIINYSSYVRMESEDKEATTLGYSSHYKKVNIDVLIGLARIAMCYDTTLVDCVGRAYRKLKEK